jgi:outer membrane protein assembly factor BamB
MRFLSRKLSRNLASCVCAFAPSCLILFSSPACGQVRIMQLPLQQGNFNQGIPGSTDDSGGVYVRDSAIAMEKLALARRMERLHEWGKSADVYQEILEKYPDRVVPSGEDPQTHTANKYVSVTETVRESLCKWPDDGLLVYRSRYETDAAKLLDAAGSDGLDKLQQVLFLYFPTDAAKTAAIRLMDVYFEQGDYVAVAQTGRHLLDWHPNLVAERPMVLYRTAMAQKLVGQADDAGRCLDELRRNFPQATGMIRGNDVLLADSLEKELASANLVRGEGSDSWLSVGGDPSRSKYSSSTVRPGARLYSIPLPQPSWTQIPDQAQRHQIELTDEDQRKRGAGLGIMPAVDHGQLFFQDNTRIYALDLDSGGPLPGWIATYPTNGAYTLSDNPTPVPLGRQLCVTINDRYVAAVMGLSDPIAQSPMVPDQSSRLVCLDRKTGKEIWTASLHNLPDAQSALRDLQMGGSPLMVGDNLYVIAHSSRGRFEDCYVLCYGLASGQFRWASFIANSSSEMNISTFADDSILYSDSVSHIAYASGRLFVVTNLGAVASLDAYTGTIDWLDIYHRTDNSPLPMGFNQPILRPGSATVPWTYNPAVVEDGKVFVLPSDSDNLFVYDAGNGNLIQQIQLADLQESRDPNVPYSPDIPNTLLAVKDDLIYLAGARQVWQVPWRSINHDIPADSMPRYWRSADAGDQSPQVRGRAFVTADAVYLPTQLCLRRILLSTGSLDSLNSSFPKTGWDEGQEGPGNVVVTEDHVIVAGDRQIAVYTDIQRARFKLDREIVEAPKDPETRLHYAEVMFAAAQTDVALEKLEEAFQLLGGEQSLSPGPVRDRAFLDALRFGQRLAKKPDSPQQVERMFDLARAAASSVSQQVTYRIARAEHDWSEPGRDPGGAIALYQQILADPGLRAYPMPDPHTTAVSPAGAVADKAIGEILATPEGRQAYEKFEQTAADALRQAREAGDPDKLLSVAKIYPDSRVAAEAMQSAADYYESDGNPRMATQVLRLVLLRFHDQSRATVLESLARNYLQIPGHTDVAVSRLALAASISPQAILRRPMVLPDGTTLVNISLLSARDMLGRYNVKVSLDSLPDIHIPTHAQADAFLHATGQRAKPFQPPQPSDTIAGVDAMIIPLEGFARHDRIIAWSGADGLSVYPVAQNKPLFNCPAINSSPLGAAWTDGNLLIWTKDSISLIDGASGRSRWSIDITTLPAIAAPADAIQQAAELEMIGPVKPLGDRIIVATITGRIFAVDARGGRIAWQTRVPGVIDALLANDDFTVVRVQEGQNVQLQVFNSFTGEPIGRKTFGLDSGIIPVNLALAADGTLAYTLPNQLCIQDLFEANLSDGGMEPRFVTDPIPNASAMFQGCNQPDQLLIHGGRVFAVANNGTGVRVFSTDTGQPWQYHAPHGEPDFGGVFTTGSTSPNVTLHISGNYLFMLSPRRLTASRIDPPTENWDTGDDVIKTTNYEQLLYGKDYLVMVDHPGQPLAVSNRAGSRLTLNFFNRAVRSFSDKEAGLLLFTHDLSIIQDNFAIEPVEGGIAFFTGHTIQTLLGARDVLANAPPI